MADMTRNENYSRSDMVRVAVGSASLVSLIGVVYFVTMFGFLFGVGRTSPPLIDFFLGPVFWWLWPPLLLGPLVWIVTIADAYRRQPTPVLRVTWTVAVVAGQIPACIIYWTVQLWRLVLQRATAP